MGRINGLQMLVLTLARALPPEVAAKCLSNGNVGLAKVEADLIAAPIPEAMLTEMLCTMKQGLEVFGHAAKQ